MFELEGANKVQKFPSDCSKNPMVSVCVQTYNHENYIKQCLDGVLMQITNFDFEILLGEDDSSDNTRQICIDYAEKFPQKIRLFLHDRNNVIYINEKPTGRYNFVYNLSNANGKYIAICEGDDFWTDPFKLQKQVDFLENNPQYSSSSHWVDILYSNKSTLKPSKFRYKGDIGLKEILKERWTLIQTASLIFRSIYVDDHFLNSLLNFQISGDSFLIAYLSTKGKINFIEEVMTVYRKQAGGLSYHSGEFVSRKKYFQKKKKTYRGIIRYYKIIDEMYGFKESKLIRKYILGLKIDIFYSKLRMNEGSKLNRATKKLLTL